MIRCPGGRSARAQELVGVPDAAMPDVLVKRTPLNMCMSHVVGDCDDMSYYSIHRTIKCVGIRILFRAFTVV